MYMFNPEINEQPLQIEVLFSSRCQSKIFWFWGRRFGEREEFKEVVCVQSH
jgi:hypothetical protein